MIDLPRIFTILNKTKWWIIIIAFLVFIINTFSNELKRIMDVKFLNQDIVTASINDDIIITEALNELMVSEDADRAYIFRFHNGVTYYNGTHKSKMSCDYETVGLGISREAQRLQDLPTGLYATWLKEVIDYKMFNYDVSEIEDLRVRKGLEMQGILGLCVVPYYRDGKIFALIGIDYVKGISHKNRQEFFDNRVRKISDFRIKTDRIGDLLN